MRFRINIALLLLLACLFGQELLGECLSPKSTNQALSLKDNISKNLPLSVFLVLASNDTRILGSGVVVDKDGTIVTCYHVVEHVIEGADQGLVKFHDGSIATITQIIAIDPLHDLALIKSSTPQSQKALIGDSTKVELGDEVVTIGNPKGLESSISNGIVSSMRENGDDIQFTAPISSGSSGGGLFNRYGELIGITKSVVNEAQNLNFATSSRFVSELLKEKENTSVSTTSTLEQTFEQATRAYLQKNSQNPQARLALARMYLKKLDFNKALELVGTDLDQPEALYIRGYALYLKDDVAESIKLFNALPASYFETEPALYLFLANAALQSHDLSTAKLNLEKYNVFSSNKDALYYYTVGELAKEYGLRESRQIDQDQYFDKAIGFYELAAEKNGKFVGAIYKKALVQLTMGDVEGVNLTYKELLQKDPKLAKDLEVSVNAYLNAYKLANENYIREVNKERLFSTVSLLVYSLLVAAGSSSY